MISAQLTHGKAGAAGAIRHQIIGKTRQEGEAARIPSTFRDLK